MLPWLPVLYWSALMVEEATSLACVWLRCGTHLARLSTPPAARAGSRSVRDVRRRRGAEVLVGGRDGIGTALATGRGAPHRRRARKGEVIPFPTPLSRTPDRGKGGWRR